MIDESGLAEDEAGAMSWSSSSGGPPVFLFLTVWPPVGETFVTTKFDAVLLATGEESGEITIGRLSNRGAGGGGGGALFEFELERVLRCAGGDVLAGCC